MPPFRGRGRGRGRGARSSQPDRLARSGIRTRGGYKKFDSQRTREVEHSESPEPVQESEEESEDDLSEEDIQISSYSALLQTLKTNNAERPRKRRRLTVEPVQPEPVASEDDVESDTEDVEGSEGLEDAQMDDESDLGDLDDDVESRGDSDASEVDDEPEAINESFKRHYTPAENDTQALVNAAKAGWPAQKLPSSNLSISFSGPEASKAIVQRPVRFTDINIKQRLHDRAQKILSSFGDEPIPSYVLNYVDVVYGARTVDNATRLRQLSSLHAIDHVLKSRARIQLDNTRLRAAKEERMLELRDQGFTRPTVLILCETRQMAAKYAKDLAEVLEPGEQDNKKRFQAAFSDQIEERDMPDDYNELFEGNNDNSFIASIGINRQTMKFYSAYYRSDILIASPLGLRRIFENENKKKRDHDFLSSIEMLIIDQADASQMQSFDNIELVLKHLNKQPKELRDCDVNRVRNWCLDGYGSNFRQTIIFSAYLTPELNRLYNSTLQNIAGKVKISKQFPGAIQSATGLGIKQTFLRFPATSPADDPDARFKYFTTSVLPLLLRQRGQGTLVFVPSYFDFLRVRNFFATSTLTENISFGAISDYSDPTEQRRARSHFMSGRHSFLLYTQRAHHFFRLRIKGVKNVVMYGLPDNEIFYREIVGDYLSSTLESGVGGSECSSRAIFSKFDALKLERVVGTSRFKNMLVGVGDTFDFV